MFRLVAGYGLAAGLIVAVAMVYLMLSHSMVDRSARGTLLYTYLVTLIALTSVFPGIKEYRDKVLGGVVKFGPALLVGLGISTVASIIYVIEWEISLAVSGFDFAHVVMSMVGSAILSGATPAQLQEVSAKAQTFATMYANPLYRLPITFLQIFPIGVLFSLIAAALLRHSR